MIRSARILAIVLPLAASLGLLAQAALADTPRQPAAVEVPVLVLADGQPVRGLTRDDFLLEDGRSPQALTGFTVLDLQSPQSRETAVALVPAAARRHFLLFFDLAFSEPAAVVRARDAARRLVDGALHPADLVAVATYSLAQGPRLVLGFTSDRRQARAALDTLGLPQLAGGPLDPLGLLLPGPAGEAKALDGEALAAAVASTRTVKESPADVNRDRNRIAAFARAIADLARLMGSVEGRKDVVLFSAGFDSSRLVGTVTDVQINLPHPDRSAGGQVTIESNERPGFTRSTSELVRMLEELRRADCTVQAVDIGSGSSAGGGERAGAAHGPKGQDGLAVLAEGTGGEVYRGFDDLAQAMGSLLARTSVTYVLSFQPGDRDPDGKFHPLRVRLKDERGGRRVVHRTGWYAPLPWEKQNGLERQLAGAGRMLGGEEGGALPISLLAAAFPVAGQKAYVPVLVEIDGAAITGIAGSTGSTGPGNLQAELLAYAFDAGGEIRDHFSQTLGLDLAKVGPTLRQGGLKVYGHLDLDPGEYVVRVLVREGRGNHGVATARVSVPRPDAAAAALLPPLVPDPPAPNRWLMVREPEARSKLRQVPYPFMLREQPFVPAARPVLPPGGEVRLSLVGWGLGGDPLGADAQLYGADGAPRPGGEIRIRERMPGGMAGSDQIVATFRPGGVAAGAYTLVVTLTDPDSGRKQSSSIPVTVTAEGTVAGRSR